MLIWTDLETTGLEQATDAILEIAVVVTDDSLNEIAAKSWVTDAARSIAFGGLHPNVQTMHTKNGLWLESLTAGAPVDAIGRDLETFLALHIGPNPPERPPLAGSGVHFDRAFIRRVWRAAHDLLHYRNLDVSAFVETSKRFWPGVHLARPYVPEDQKVHRAMPDIRESINALRYYLANVAPVGASAAITQSSVEAPGPVTVAAVLAAPRPKAPTAGVDLTAADGGIPGVKVAFGKETDDAPEGGAMWVRE